MDTISQKLAQSVVLLGRQFLLIEHLVKTHGKCLQEFESQLENKSHGINNVLDVYNYVFALIDNLVRYQKIAYVLPMLNQKAPEYRSFNLSMGNLKDVRNQIQHLNNDIENDFSGPLLGAIFWANKNRQYIATFNDIGRNRSSPSISFDTESMEFHQDFCYVYNDINYDLSESIKGVRVFQKYIDSKVSVTVDEKPYFCKEHYTALCFKLGS